MLIKFLPREWSRQRQADTQVDRKIKRSVGVMEALELAMLKAEPLQGSLVDEGNKTKPFCFKPF